MKSLYLLLFLFGSFFLISSSHADTADSDKGQHLFKRSCATCHGRQGEKSAMNQSAVIQKMKKDEIITALQARKSGEIDGAGNMAKSRLSEQDMQHIAEYVESLGK
ncbi:cytochrome c553 [Cricetibacter osteomyelitidis]|uniref:Cytochrome c553 n=1 Tax=Cricetibacter osteomyelitidis TaxID=1521931 RepID=A0A4R2STY7_9PAST|nr:c-type cytochrome [Cricetibacter osteomyelitidis]TCP92201.1 cytochrome c553 [Cricetibacter osteomyelitidis]